MVCTGQDTPKNELTSLYDAQNFQLRQVRSQHPQDQLFQIKTLPRRKKKDYEKESQDKVEKENKAQAHNEENDNVH